MHTAAHMGLLVRRHPSTPCRVFFYSISLCLCFPSYGSMTPALIKWAVKTESM